jgi:hypothetical protein
MPHNVGDVVRIVSCTPGAIIAPFVGSEAKVLAKHESLPLYTIAIDLGRWSLDPPKFVAREDMLESEVTETMLRAADAVLEEVRNENPSVDVFGEAECARIYRAMRAARYEP